MAFVTTFRIEGDPDQLLKFKHETMDPVVEPIARENGIIEHITCKTDSGIVIFNLWETIEGSEKTAEAARGAAEGQGGEPPSSPTDWQSYEIVQREVIS
jgi:hypothetical protein